jgi:hypothetical protein
VLVTIAKLSRYVESWDIARLVVGNRFRFLGFLLWRGWQLRNHILFDKDGQFWP